MLLLKKKKAKPKTKVCIEIVRTMESILVINIAQIKLTKSIKLIERERKESNKEGKKIKKRDNFSVVTHTTSIIKRSNVEQLKHNKNKNKNN